MEKSTTRFMRGAVILSAAGIICKIIGAIYRIPLTNIIGTEAMGIYSKAYLLYALLWMISTSGLPSAIAKTVAACNANNDKGNAMRIFTVSRRLMLIMGTAFTLLLMALSPVVASLLGIPNGAVAVLCIAPSLMLVVVSAYMGYFQGNQFMAPSALTQIIGSSGKLVAGTLLAFLLKDKGIVYAAAGALLGVTASELLSIFFIHFRFTKYNKNTPCPPPVTAEPYSDIIKKLIRTALPITLCGAAIPLLNTLDAYLITHCLGAKGFSTSQINSMYGVLNGMVSTLVNVPGALAISLSAALIPFVSRFKVKKDTAGVSAVSTITAKLSLVIGLPCAIGLFLFAKPIISFLYPISATVSALDQQLGITLLRLVCPAIIGLSVMHSLTGALQGAEKSKLPVISLAVAAVIKLGLGAILMLLTPLNILSAPIASSAAFIVAGIMNFVFASKHCGVKINLRSSLAILLSGTVMGVAGYIINALFAPSGIWLILWVILCGAIYLIILYLLKVFSKEEIKMMPFSFGKK